MTDSGQINCFSTLETWPVGLSDGQCSNDSWPVVMMRGGLPLKPLWRGMGRWSCASAEMESMIHMTFTMLFRRSSGNSQGGRRRFEKRDPVASWLYGVGLRVKRTVKDEPVRRQNS